MSIASQVSVALKTTAIDYPEYTGDDTFTPELASTLVNIFQVELERRMEAPTYNVGDTDDQILLENGLVPGDKIILDGKSTTSTTTSNVDFSILLEDSLQPSGYGYDTAYIVLDSSGVGFTDEHGKIDLESGVIFENLMVYYWRHLLLQYQMQLSLQELFLVILMELILRFGD